MRTGACEPQVPFQGSKDLDDGGDDLVDKNTCCASMTCVQILSIHVELGMAMQACNPSIRQVVGCVCGVDGGFACVKEEIRGLLAN